MYFCFIIKLFMFEKIRKLFSKKEQTETIDDEYKVVMAGNIMIAQRYKCDKCNLIRPYNLEKCNCKG